MFNHKLPTDFPMQTLRKKTSPCKYKNEPGRFLGEGVSFRAKLIGVLEVPEARGDRMCQEALADLKMAIRAAGEHKQRIQVHVAIDGLRLRDDKTGDSLYHHPVHKISFIAQDMTDSRAFGYIFGSPDSGHRFFGIKTDKAASQVVIAMRDLFQVVFELKKKEIELAKQQLEGKSSTSVNLVRNIVVAAEPKATTSIPASVSESAKPEPESGVAELVSLEQELSSLRRGLTQVEGLAPDDPFGDSFINQTQGLLPPPPSCRLRSLPASGSPSLSQRRKMSQDKPTEIALHTAKQENAPISYDVFTDLDPLGTGRSRPYVDKKLFFQELKNPPKKVLKDLVPSNSTLLSEILTKDVNQYGVTTTMTSLSRQSGGSMSIAKQAADQSQSYFEGDPFANSDPFDSTDPFSDFKDDPFKNLQDITKAKLEEKLPSMEMPKLKSIEICKVEKKEEKALNGKTVFNGHLHVSLPPETTPKSPRLQRQRESSSPPPPLPPKKDLELKPPIPPPNRKKEIPIDRSLKPIETTIVNSSEDEYLSPAPPPLPTGRRFDITLAQLLTCSMEQLSDRLNVPVTTLSSMTLPQLTTYLRSYLAADSDRAHIHVEKSEKDKTETKDTPQPIPPPAPINITKPSTNTNSRKTTRKKDIFEDNFTPTDSTFVANFDDFDKKVNTAYDRYAVFREIQTEELVNSILTPTEERIDRRLEITKEEKSKKETKKEDKSKREDIIEIKVEERVSPLKSLDELTLDSFNMFRKSVSPKPTVIESKIEDIKNVMKNLKIEETKKSVSPNKDSKKEDRYAALRDITIEPPEQYDSIPSDAPKERKRSDEKSDGFDNSDFFDCIDHSSLSFSHVDDAFKKSPLKKEMADVKEAVKKETKVEDPTPPPRLSTESLSDVNSGSSPDVKEREGMPLGAWWVYSSESEQAPQLPKPRRKTNERSRQTSSSSRDVSPWDDEPSHIRRHRTTSHHRDRDSRRNSFGSRECVDVEPRERGRDRDRDRDVCRRERERKSRDREREYWRERDRHRDRWRQWEGDEDYSDGCGSGRSSPSNRDRDRWHERRRRDDRNYGSLGYRESRRRPDVRQSDESDRSRYSTSMSWSSRRSNNTGGSTRRDTERRRRHNERQTRRERYDYSPRDKNYDDDYKETSVNSGKKRPQYASLEGTRFAFEAEETTASPISASSVRARDGETMTRFRFDSDSVSPRSMFEDDFTPRTRADSIVEEEENELPPLKQINQKETLKKSESVNIFARESDPFENDDFFACTGSDRAGKRENWPGDFQHYDN